MPGALLFALTAGEQSLTVQMNRESAVFHQLIFTAPPQAEAYAAPEGAPAKETIRLQGEKAAYRSDAAICPTADRASALTEPNKGAQISLNMIGGSAWSKPNSFITWEFDVPEDGLYTIRLRKRQSTSHAFSAMRTLLIDGKVPFTEVSAIPFSYSGTWNVVELGDGTPYLFALSKGHHTLTLQATLGDQAQYISAMQQVMLDLSDVYTQILMLTGADPDPLRDYAIDKNIPGALTLMEDCKGRMEEIVATLMGKASTKGNDLVAVERLIRELTDFIAQPYTIPENFDAFKTNLSALGEWIQGATERPLDIDYIDLAVPGSPLPRAEAGFFQNIAYQAQLFFDSFVTDYSSFSGNGGNERTITVWVTSSRDRAQILSDMIRTDFTPRTGIHVNLQLVVGDFVTSSVSVGSGPDVLLEAAMSDPVNYATRHAAYDLTQFDDLQEVLGRFSPEAAVPFTFDSGVYALPETMSYMMMFYRKDIIEKLGIVLPDTWEDMVNLIPVLSRNNMMFLVDGRLERETYGSLTALSMFLFQNNGQVYKKDGTATDLDSEAAITAFKKLTRLYTNYGMPYSFNTSARFRSGEAPLVIADYTLYTTLMASAPEIAGQWGMTLIPGTAQADGTLNRAARVVVSGDMILRSSKDPEAAWEFLKWCTGEEVQAAYSRQLESILGSAARYPTANLNAMEDLNWSSEDLKALKEQMAYVRGVPEVPGGYYTKWHVENAFRSVVISGNDPRETMLDYVRTINEEIAVKRKELGLDTGEGE